MSKSARTILRLGKSRTNVRALKEEDKHANAETSYLSKRTGGKVTPKKVVAKTSITVKKTTPRVETRELTKAELREELCTRLKYAVNMADGTEYDDHTARHLYGNFSMGIIICNEDPRLAYAVTGLFHTVERLYKQGKYKKLFRKVKTLYTEFNEEYELNLPEI